jgi:hypothetical protein
MPRRTDSRSKMIAAAAEALISAIGHHAAAQPAAP